MFYSVMKSGLPMFDSCRAYGLALALERLSREVGWVEHIRIKDMGPMYLVVGPDEAILTSVDPTGLFDDLLALNDGWCGTFLTTARSPREAKLKPASRRALSQQLDEVGKILARVSDWLSTFIKPQVVDLRIRPAEGYQTLPSSLDVSAAKGLRRLKRDGYGEGEQVYITEPHWAIGLLGGAHFIRWTWAGGNYVGLLPTPAQVTFHHHRDIRAIADVGFLCSVSVQTAAAHYVIRLAEALRQRRASQATFADRYENLIVQAMAYAGSQWKPQGGGLFPLELPMGLIEGDLAVAADIFKLWDFLFRRGSVRGAEMLALTLAEFLAQPSLETFEQHARAHLRLTLADERTRSFPPYQTEWMKEVLSHV